MSPVTERAAAVNAAIDIRQLASKNEITSELRSLVN